MTTVASSEQTDAVLEKQDIDKDSNPTDGGETHHTWPSGGGSAVSRTGFLWAGRRWRYV